MRYSWTKRSLALLLGPLLAVNGMLSPAALADPVPNDLGAVAAPEADPTVPPSLQYSDDPGIGHALARYPSDYHSFLTNAVSYDWQIYAALATGTLALMPLDQRMADGSRSYALRHHIMTRGPQDHILSKFSIFGAEQEIRAPKSVNGVFWYFGDGILSLGLVAGFGLYGYATASVRSAHVATQIIESLLISGPTVLLLKMATGREAPSRASRRAGMWHGYPGVSRYAKDQSKYYSFPSGHVTTAVSTLTVLAENFVEKKWIMPVGGVMVSLLMMTLMNVGSHWPSDYPLAVFIGYTAAHTVVAADKAPVPAATAGRGDPALPPNAWRWTGVAPQCNGDGCGLTTSWQF